MARIVEEDDISRFEKETEKSVIERNARAMGGAVAGVAIETEGVIERKAIAVGGAVADVAGGAVVGAAGRMSSAGVATARNTLAAASAATTTVMKKTASKTRLTLSPEAIQVVDS